MSDKKFTPIYKFRAVNTFTEDLVQKGELYFCPPKDFNDPFDSNLELIDFVDKEDILGSLSNPIDPRSNALFNVLSQALESNKTKEILYTHFKESFYSHAETTGICCFSKTPLDLLLWAHYSDCHKGICLVFDSDILIETFGELHTLNYSQKIPDINIFGDAALAVNQFFCTKSEHWSYEKESRLIKIGAGSFKFPKKALVGIIVGLKCSIEDQFKIVSKIVDNDYDHVQLYKTVIDKRNYQLHIERVPFFKNVSF
jgi:hypothetical protein